MMKDRKNSPPSTSPPRRTRRRGATRSLLIAFVLAAGVVTLAAGGAFLPGRIQSAAAAPGAMQDAAASGEDFSPEVLRQMQALLDEKESRTPAQQKIDSQLLYALKEDRGEPVAAGVQTLAVNVGESEQGSVVVDISGTVGDDLLNTLAANGAKVLVSTPEYNSVRVEVALDRLEAIAASPAVRFIQPKQNYMLSRDTPAPGGKLPGGVTLDRAMSDGGFRERAARVRARLTEALARFSEADAQVAPGSMTIVGSRQSEGDVTHRANTARGTFNTDGTGIKIGVLSDGVSNLADSQGRGDLPRDVTILSSQGGSGDEGTAMLEIVHDLAPGAKLFFATAFSGTASFASNIRALRTAGCDIIVDDVFYFVETPFQDGQAPSVPSTTNGSIILQAVNDVTAAGALYFSSAGNQGNKDANTSSCFQGDFVDGGPSTPPLPLTGNVHNFGGSNFDTIAVGSGNPINLFWADPLGGSANDYDLFVLNNTSTTVVASSTNVQNGTQDPFEQVSTGNMTGNRIVVLKKTGAANRFFYLTINANGQGRLAISTEGTTKGHNMAANAYSVAATPAVGPFPNPFSSTNVTETFSSDGPRRIFFNADGTPITPGNFSSTGGTLRQKPDITAADGVSVTGVGGFPSIFFGTSAAAPHAAAIAGLIKAANPALTPAQIRTALTSSAIDIQSPGVDRDSGVGIIMAYQALQAAGVVGTANLQVGTVTAAEVGGNGDGFVEPGEAGTLAVQLTNTGVNDATGITSFLSTSTPGVSITQASSSYPAIPNTNGAATNTTPFNFAISSTASCPSSIDFTLTVNYTGGPSPKALNFSVAVSQTATINETLDNTTPVSKPPLFTAATGTQTGRLARVGTTSNCGSPKPSPALNDSANRRFDSYTFSNPTASPICVSVTLTTPAANAMALQSAAYSVYDQTKPDTNYLGDIAANGPASRSYSFTAPASASFTVVVSEIATGSVGTTPYTLKVDGLPCAAASTVNQPPVNGVPGPQTVVENAQVVFSTANGNAVSVSDPDAGSNPLKVTLTVAHGTLTLAGTTGLSFTNGNGTANPTMTFTGTAAFINLALNGLTYRPAANFAGADTLTIVTDDQGFLGSGGAKTDTDSVALTVAPGSAFQFDSPGYQVGESDGLVTLTVTRAGDISTAATVNFATVNGTASDRSDYEGAAGTLQFAPGQFSANFSVLINEDSLVEGTETFTATLSNPQGTGVALDGQTTATVTILDNASEPATNAVDDTTGFVRQHYHDFLNREPDPAGLAFWKNNIDSCGSNAQCREVQRVSTSAAFFLSIEFQQTGYFVYRAYTASFGPTRVGSTVPLTVQEFLPDAQQVGRNVIIGTPGADTLLESNKQAYLLQFVQRPAFTTAYPGSLTPAQFVDALNVNTGNSLTQSQRDALVAQLTANNTAQGRADVLRQVIDNSAFQAREFNRAFVLMQYFGYLRRNPNDSPDADFSGYNFWLGKLNTFGGDFQKAEMVKAFITSFEFRKRFGQN
jgi:hypothetical protein